MLRRPLKLIEFQRGNIFQVFGTIPKDATDLYLFATPQATNDN